MQGDDPNNVLESSRMINKRLKNENTGNFPILFIQTIVKTICNILITLLHLSTLVQNVYLCGYLTRYQNAFKRAL